MSQLKKKDKLDLSKLTAKELLLIGESQTLGTQPCSSKSATNSCSSSEYMSDDDDSSEGNKTDRSEEDEEEEDWEEVDDRHVEAQLQKFDNSADSGEGTSITSEQSQLSQIPENGLEIVIPKEGVFRKKGKKRVTVEDILRSEMNREIRDIQEYMHKASVLCQLARGLKLNLAVNSTILHDIFKERIKGQSFSGKRLDLSKLERFMKWFRVNMIIEKPSMVPNLEESRKQMSDEEFIAYQIMEKTAVDANNYVMIFIAFLRYLSVDARLVVSVNVIPLKPPSEGLIKKPKKEDSDDEETEKGTKSKKRKGNIDKKKDNKGSTSKNTPSSSKKKGSSSTKKATPSKTGNRGRPTRSNSGRKMISSSDEEAEIEVSQVKPVKTEVGQDMWAEVFLIEEERWISVDVYKGKVICDKQLEMEASKPMVYVLGFNNQNKVKDITRRYASEWLTGTQKLRAKSEWLNETLKPFRGKKTARDKEEDEYLDQHLLSLPVPKSLSEIKGHPLFVVRRHLLKYESLYPDNPPSVGFIKDEAIYSREYVHTLHTRELWMREAKVVRIGEAPYKIVKGRPKYDKLSGARLPETPSELFGEWQTEDFIPPIAQNGKVPRNEWGNVELFTEKLLPQGCVHLKLPGLQRIAKKLDIDCAPAVVGFDYGSMGSRPAFDGFVVCQEFQETLTDAWNQEQEEKKKRDEEKRLQRIYGNWRRLIKSVLIRDRLEKKYSVNLSGKRKTDNDAGTSSKKRKR